MRGKTKTNYIFIILTGIFLACFLKIFVIDILTVEGNSMIPSLKNGQNILVNKLSYGLVNPFGSTLIVKWAEPKENDIVIFLYNNDIVVKRCVATGGTSLDYLTDNDYSLIVGGKKKITLSQNQYHKMFKSSFVPTGYILAVGDNYTESYDSRNYGFVPVENILGKIICK